MNAESRKFVTSDFLFDRETERHMPRVIELVDIARKFIRTAFPDKVSERDVRIFLQSCDVWVRIRDIHNLYTYDRLLLRAGAALNA